MSSALAVRRSWIVPAALAAVVAVAGVAYGLWPRPTGPRSALVVEPSPVDFGSVPWLSSATKRVVLRNRSDREVMLRDPHFDCSCFSIVRAADAVRLRPGQSTSVDVLLYSQKAAPGRFHKTFTVESDDPVSPKLDTPVLGTITDFRQVSPREVYFGDVDAAAEPVAKTVEVRGGAGWTVDVVDVVSPDPRIVVERKPVADGADLVVRTKKGIEKGRLDAQVQMTLEVKGADDAAPRRYAESFWIRATVK